MMNVGILAIECLYFYIRACNIDLSGVDTAKINRVENIQIETSLKFTYCSRRTRAGKWEGLITDTARKNGVMTW